MCFPTFPRFCGQTFYEGKDKELGLACVKAYNDWMVEDWCGDTGGRLIPLIIIPLWDAELAVAEVERNAARGVHAVCFSELPPTSGSRRSTRATGTPSSPPAPPTTRGGHAHRLVLDHGGASPDAPPSVSATLAFGGAMASMTDFMMSRDPRQEPRAQAALRREPDRLDPPRAPAHRPDLARQPGLGQTKHIPELPSTYFHRNIFSCFINDPHGLRSLDEIGLKNVMIETDYPHRTPPGRTPWPSWRRSRRASARTRSTGSPVAMPSSCSASTSIASRAQASDSRTRA